MHLTFSVVFAYFYIHHVRFIVSLVLKTLQTNQIKFLQPRLCLPGLGFLAAVHAEGLPGPRHLGPVEGRGQQPELVAASQPEQDRIVFGV